MSDEFGDYAGDEQKTIRTMLTTCECGGVFDRHDGCDVPDCDISSAVLGDSDLEWEVCGTCRGRGTSSLYLGSFSTEQLWEDPEFAEEYMEGRYDRPCPECDGRTTVQVVTEAAMERPLVAEWFRDMSDLRAEEMAERRMGA